MYIVPVVAANSRQANNTQISHLGYSWIYINPGKPKVLIYKANMLVVKAELITEEKEKKLQSFQDFEECDFIFRGFYLLLTLNIGNFRLFFFILLACLFVCLAVALGLTYNQNYN